MRFTVIQTLTGLEADKMLHWDEWEHWSLFGTSASHYPAAVKKQQQKKQTTKWSVIYLFITGMGH